MTATKITRGSLKEKYSEKFLVVKNDNNEYRIRLNYEFLVLIKNEDIVKFIKAEKSQIYKG